MTDNEVAAVSNYVKSRFPFPIWKDRDDLVQTGLVGALIAEPKYDATRGASRLTYLRQQAYYAVLNWLRTQVSPNAEDAKNRVKLVGLTELVERRAKYFPNFGKEVEIRDQLQKVYDVLNEKDHELLNARLRAEDEGTTATALLGRKSITVKHHFRRIKKRIRRFRIRCILGCRAFTAMRRGN